MKPNNLKVSGNKKTKWPKLDSHNQIRLPMTDRDGPYKKTKWPKLDSQIMAIQFRPFGFLVRSISISHR
jgi:hypothetical protein